MISLVWTKNNSVLSRFIRWIFGEPCSHFAYLLDEKLVFHSNLVGVHLTWFDWFKDKNELVHRVDLDLTLPEQEELYLKILKLFRSGKYDYGAMFYFGISGLLHKIFGRTMPSKNAWGSENAWMCEELFLPLSEQIQLPASLDIITPERLYLLVVDSKMLSKNGHDRVSEGTYI